MMMLALDSPLLTVDYFPMAIMERDMAAAPLRIVLIDDDEDSFLITRDLLAKVPTSAYQLDWVNTYDAGLAALRHGGYDACILDYRLGARDGVELLRQAVADRCRVPIVMLTGVSDFEIDQQALKIGAADYLVKTALDISRLERSIRYAVERQRLLHDLEKHAEDLRISAAELERYRQQQVDTLSRRLGDRLAELEAILDIIPVCIWIAHDRQCRWVTGNRLTNELMNVPKGTNLSQTAPAEEQLAFKVCRAGKEIPIEELPLSIAAARGIPVPPAEFDVDLGAGRVVNLVGCAVPLLAADGQVRSAIAAAWDITSIKRSDEKLREREQQFRELFESSPDAIFVEDLNGRVLDVNPAACRLHNTERTELIGKYVLDLVPPDRRPEVAVIFPKLARGEMSQYEGFSWTQDQQAIPVELRVSRITYADQPALLLHVRDISARRQAEEKLRQSEERYRGVVEGSLQGILIHQDDRIRYVNPAIVEMFGYSSAQELLGCSIWEKLIAAEDWPELQARTVAFYRGERLPLHPGWRGIRKDGTMLWVAATASRIDWEGRPAICAFMVDITERKQAEEERRELEGQLQHRQKLESLGILAGGIAHDFNNLLTGILGYADLAMLELAPASPIRHYIEQLTTGARRAADLTQQMLAYSGKSRFVLQHLQLSDVVKEMSHLLRVSISKKCDLYADLAPDLPAIEADAAQLRQVVMNLILNAAEAIGDDIGVITLRTRLMNCTRDYLAGALCDGKLPEGPYVAFEVADTGCGMTPETVSRIFDPFFTTKATGRGLGLGAVLGIIRSHHGAIKIDSQPSRGTTFTVLFPPSPQSRELRAESQEPIAESREPRAESQEPHGTILIIDDEAAVRGLAKTMVEKMGFTTLLAADGREGIDVFRAHAARIAVVLLDLTMPRMSGVETFRELRGIRDEVRVILSSGYNEERVSTQLGTNGLAGFLQKPYKFEELEKALRGALAESREPRGESRAESGESRAES